MKLLKDTPFEVVHFPLEPRPGMRSRTVVVKATYALTPAGECTLASAQRFPTGELHYDDDVQQSLRHPDDLVPHKPRGECFVLGAFHAPAGQPLPHGQVFFRIGAVQKAVAVFGERRWTTWGPSEPKPTARVPLRWEYAFGGPRHPENPVGRGLESVPQLEHPTRLLTSPNDRAPPTSTGPLSRTWPLRAKLAGTYDREWLRTSYPCLPADIDLAYFCSAPADQRIDGMWRGDEEILLLNLVPEWPDVRCRLPGLVARAAWVNEDPAIVRELPLALDTITVDGDAREVHALWRCTTAEPSDCTHLAVLHHRLDARIELGPIVWAMLERQRQEDGAGEPEAQPAAAPSAAAAAPASAPPAGAATLSDAAARQSARADGGVAAALAAGLGGAIEPARPLDPARMAELEAEAALVEARQAEARDAEARERWTRSFRARRRVERAVGRGQPCAGWDLADLDLAGLTLDGADLSGADLRTTSLRGAVLSRCSLDGAILDGADLTGARWVGVSLRATSLVGCSAEGARLEDCNVRDALFEGATLSRAHLVRARGQASFHGATITECWLEECELEHADFGEAVVERTLFSRTNLAEAHFGDGASLKQSRFEQCNLLALRAFEADCEELFVTESMAARARFGGSKLTRARFLVVNLERADFTGADLTEAAFARSQLRKVRFDEAVLARSQLPGADLFQARLEKCDLRGADLRGANLFQAELFGALLEGARLDLANLQGTRLVQP